MDNLIELTGENGKELFEILLRFRLKGTDYIALRPEKEDEETVAVFEVRKLEGGQEQYITISDTNLAKEVFVHFVSIWEMAQEESEDEDE